MMPRLSTVSRHALTSGILLLFGLVACTGSGPDGGADPGAEARMLYDQFEREYQLHRDTQALALGARLLTEYPDHPLGDAVTADMITSAVRLPDLDRARDLALAFPDRFAGSVHRDAAMTAAARGLAEGERQEDAIRVLARLADFQDDAGLASTSELASALAATMEPAVVAALAAEPAVLSLAPVLGGEVGPDGLIPTAAAVPGRIGVLIPLTGRYARFGNAYQAGVQMARRAEDPQETGPWEIVLEDTEGDPVAAALATRRLIHTPDWPGCR